MSYRPMPQRLAAMAHIETMVQAMEQGLQPNVSTVCALAEALGGSSFVVTNTSNPVSALAYINLLALRDIYASLQPT